MCASSPRKHAGSVKLPAITIKQKTAAPTGGGGRGGPPAPPPPHKKKELAKAVSFFVKVILDKARKDYD